jgi:hypothetical protein
MPLSEITSAISVVKAALDIGRTLRDSQGSLKEAEYNTKITDLLEKLVEVQSGLVDARQTILEQQERIAQLKATQEIRDRRLVGSRGAYYVAGREGADSSADGPFCTRCWDVDELQVRLQDMGNGMLCPQCKTFYE